MKYFGLSLMSLFLSAFLLTSCLEGGSVLEGGTLGVVSYGKTTPYIIKTPMNGDLYTPSLNSLINNGELSTGDCVYFQYRYDSKLPENAPNLVALNEYLTITLIDMMLINKSNLISYLTDTALVLPNELPIIKGCKEDLLFEGYLFMATTVSIQEDVELEWNMSYDPANMMPVTENGERYYDVFLRATIRKGSDKVLKYEASPINAYYMLHYLQNAASIERTNLGSAYKEDSSTITVRLNYASSIDAVTNEITWKSDLLEYKIGPILSSY